MKRVCVGYYIRRTVKNPHPGDTIGCITRIVYPTREDAEYALTKQQRSPEFDYDVTEAWMTVEDEP